MLPAITPNSNFEQLRSTSLGTIHLSFSINTGIAWIPVRLKIAVFCLPDHSLENENSASNSFV